MKNSQLISNCIISVLIIILCGCDSNSVTTIESFDEVTVSFDNVGEGEPTLLFIHGWSNNRSIWDTQIEHFSQKHQIIAVDLPGFGKSGNNRNEWTMENFGKDIAEIVNQLKLDDVVVVGFSMGAPVAIEAARQIPDKIEGIVLVDNIQQIEMQIPPPMAHFMDSLMMDLINHPTQEKLVSGGFFKHNIDAATKRVMELLDGASHIGWQESLKGYMDWTNESCTKSVQAVKAPIVAINSDMQPTNVEDWKKYSPTFKAKIVKDVGHVIMWDNPTEFNRLLKESIQEFVD